MAGRISTTGETGKEKKKKKHKNHLISSTENIWQQQMQGGL